MSSIAFARLWLLHLSAAIMAVWFSVAVQAHAQEPDAEVVAAEGVLAYRTQHYEEALTLLRRALEFHPQDARALYYLGLTHLGLGQIKEAVSPLESVYGLRPDDLDVMYQLGGVYFALAQFDKAEPLLEETFRRQPDFENLGYYVGFLRYRHKNYQGAAEAFGAVRSSDVDIRQLAKFYRGLSLGVLGLSDQALSELALVQQVQPMSPITGASVRIQEALAATPKKRDLTRFNARLTLGGFYDDNVAINPNSNADPFVQALRARPTRSPGFLTSLQADYAFYRQGPLEAKATYSFYQTVNTNSGVGSFDIQDHLGGLSGAYRGTLRAMPYELGAQYTYDYMFLGLDGFLSRQSLVLPAVIVPPSTMVPGLGTVQHLTTVLYRHQTKNFFLEPGDNDIRFAPESRDAQNNMFGFLHVFRFAQDRYLLRLGYQHDTEASKGTAFTYRGNRLQTGGEMVLPWQNIAVRMDYEWHWRDYQYAQTVFTDNDGRLSARDDTTRILFLQLSKPFPYSMTVALQYQGIWNDSNIPVYDYTKNVVTAQVTWAY
ncbi:MAG: tetratricopeptide repeat protein [Nitrospirae bacterium]|nr:tetratricopeptide repeat protein [Nitrospirota bacterium]